MRRLPYLLAACLVVHATWPIPLAAAQQPAPANSTQPDSQTFDTQQLDALLAPIALYPDTLLTQVLMATTCKGKVVAIST